MNLLNPSLMLFPQPDQAGFRRISTIVDSNSSIAESCYEDVTNLDLRRDGSHARGGSSWNILNEEQNVDRVEVSETAEIDETTDRMEYSRKHKALCERPKL